MFMIYYILLQFCLFSIFATYGQLILWSNYFCVCCEILVIIKHLSIEAGMNHNVLIQVTLVHKLLSHLLLFTHFMYIGGGWWIQVSINYYI